MAKEFVPINEAAAYLYCNARWLARQAQQGLVPAYKVGKRWLFDLDELAVWVEEQANNARQHRRKKIKLEIG